MYSNSMFPPLTTVVKNLLIANTLVFVAQLTFQNKFPVDDWFAQHHFLSKDFRPFQILTYMFLHGSWGHLFGNMLGLYLFGTKLEMIWGAKRFFSFYIICGIGAGLISGLATLVETYPVISDLNLLINDGSVRNFNVVYNHQQWFDPAVLYKYRLNPDAMRELRTLLNADPTNPQATKMVFKAAVEIKEAVTSSSAIGASGCVYGLLAGAAYLIPNDLIPFQFFIPLQVKWVALIYGAGEVWSAIQNDPNDQVAHVAHLGGGLVGFLMLWFSYRRNNRRKLF